jgi:hypothetical protein
MPLMLTSYTGRTLAGYAAIFKGSYCVKLYNWKQLKC